MKTDTRIDNEHTKNRRRHIAIVRCGPDEPEFFSGTSSFSQPSQGFVCFSSASMGNAREIIVSAGLLGKEMPLDITRVCMLRRSNVGKDVENEWFQVSTESE